MHIYIYIYIYVFIQSHVAALFERGRTCFVSVYMYANIYNYTHTHTYLREYRRIEYLASSAWPASRTWRACDKSPDDTSAMPLRR